MSYISLKEKSRYLKEVGKGAGRDLREDEITTCEDFANVYIEGYLGKSWASDSVPKMIEQIADMLASSRAWIFLHSGQVPKNNEYGKELKAEAKEMLKEIIKGVLGLKMPDGSWDSDYPGDKNKEEKNPDDLEILI